jgi:steroid delta-isomerase-like uncharacterized protein
MIAAVRSGKLSRRRFVAAMTGLGISAAGATTVLAVATHRTTRTEHVMQLRLHDQHVTRQVQGDVNAMMADYADDAVVEDPLFAAPFMGKGAIAERYAAEVASVPDRTLRILSRAMSGGQLIVEWEATGTHQADFLGFGGTGRRYTLHGVTVVTRQDGKIVRESHYYDAADLRRQVEG